MAQAADWVRSASERNAESFGGRRVRLGDADWAPPFGRRPFGRRTTGRQTGCRTIGRQTGRRTFGRQKKKFEVNFIFST